MTEISFGVHENVSVSKVQGVEVDSGPDDLYGGTVSCEINLLACRK